MVAETKMEADADEKPTTEHTHARTHTHLMLQTLIQGLLKFMDH